MIQTERSNPISFTGLLEKFTGNKSQISAEAWCRKFLRISKLKGWSEDQIMEVFKAWVDGEAEEWVYELEQDDKSKDWDVSKWFENLKKRFPFAVSQTKSLQLTTKALEDLKLTKNESIKDFNRRFMGVLYQVPEEWYTDSLIKRIYSNLMLNINEGLAWTVMEKLDYNEFSSSEVMKEFQDKHEKREVLLSSILTEQKKKVSPEKHDSKSEEESDFDVKELTKMVKYLTIYVKNQNKPIRDNSYLHCFNCDGRGHRTFECPKPRNKELYKKLYA
ncbi:hypothetical protein AYI69_g4333 [Smittium culicis]|uniref:CCHC-type domain-containing protein n=1 Tax=Smittium culicis TaxID=133412 RepID=A0A1R1YEG7_9FUNG|nr:hypothetical protein AYI69_g4333 [Smittium culicis]